MIAKFLSFPGLVIIIDIKCKCTFLLRRFTKLSPFVNYYWFHVKNFSQFFLWLWISQIFWSRESFFGSVVWLIYIVLISRIDPVSADI